MSQSENLDVLAAVVSRQRDIELEVFRRENLRLRRSIVEIILRPIDCPKPVVRCGCGCGTPLNARQIFFGVRYIRSHGWSRNRSRKKQINKNP